MNLRTRLIFLIVGSAVIPPLMVFISVVAGFSTGTPVQGAQAFFFVQSIIRGDFDRLPTVQSLQASLEERERVADVVLMGANDVISYPAERAGEITSIDVLVEPSGPTRVSTVIPLVDEDGGTGYLVATNPNRDLPNRLSLMGLAVPIVFVLITSIGSALIISSLNKSTRALEEATRKIAEGNLDFKLDPGNGRDRIASLTRSFDQMRLQLKEQLDRGSRFLMGISHDLKTPLASISGYVDAINDGFADDEEKLRRYMGIISTKTQLLGSRISALIDYAKQETRDWKTTLEQVALGGFLEEFTSLVDVEAQARGFSFQAEIDVAETLQVLMDPDMVTRALENLAENAFAYAEEASTIRLRAHLVTAGVDRPGQAQIVIENDGEGIGPDDLPHIFDPLYRASASRQGSGFGLGLSIVKSVITSHGWEISVDSTPGTTTRFTIAIPIPKP